MGIRQSYGLFLTPVTRDLGVTAADYTLALAVQNIVWGASQAVIGAVADRFGLRRTMIAGAAIYTIGLAVMAVAQGAFSLILSGGLIGIALSCTATSLAMTACMRAVSEARRSATLGIVSAAGSLGAARRSSVADRGLGFRVPRHRHAARCVLGRRRRCDGRA
jgi:MFS family permease